MAWKAARSVEARAPTEELFGPPALGRTTPALVSCGASGSQPAAKNHQIRTVAAPEPVASGTEEGAPSERRAASASPPGPCSDDLISPVNPAPKSVKGKRFRAALDDNFRAKACLVRDDHSVALTRYPRPPPLCSLTRYRRSALLWVAPTSDNLRPLPRFLRLLEGAPILRHRLSDLPGYRAISMWGSIRPETPGGRCALAMTHTGLLPAGPFKPSANPNVGLFGALHLQGQHHLLSLHLASSRYHASIGPLPARLQVSIPGPCLMVTWAGFPPAR